MQTHVYTWHESPWGSRKGRWAMGQLALHQHSAMWSYMETKSGFELLSSWRSLWSSWLAWFIFLKNWDIYKHEDSQKVLCSEPFPKLTMTHTQLPGKVPDIKIQMYMSCGALPKLVIFLILYIRNFLKGPQLTITKSHSLGSWWVSGRTFHLQNTAQIAPGQTAFRHAA